MIRQRTGRLGQAVGLGLIGSTLAAMLPGMQSLLSRHATRADVAESQAALERWFAALAKVPAHGHERDGDRAGDESSGPVGESPTVIPAEAAPATLALSGSRP